MYYNIKMIWFTFNAFEIKETKYKSNKKKKSILILKKRKNVTFMTFLS